MISDLIYILLFFNVLLLVILLVSRVERYVKNYSSKQKLELTQKYIHNSQQQLDLLRKLNSLMIFKHYHLDYTDEKITYEHLYKTLLFANEIAHLNKYKIYDTDLLKSTYNYDLTIFYKTHYESIDNLRIEIGLEEVLYNLELLLRDWEVPSKTARRF